MDYECREKIREYEQKVNQLEKLFAEIMLNASEIGTVLAGPVQANGVTYYRVTAGGRDRMVLYKGTDRIECNTEVALAQALLARAVPKELAVAKVTKPFQHIGWNEVGGLKSQVESIRKQIELPLKNRKAMKEFGIKESKGILLWGPAGCGKTLISRVIASTIIDRDKGDADAFIYIKGPEILHGLVGSTEERIRSIFNQGREYTLKTGSKAVVFIDEAEALLMRRGSGISSDVNMTIVPQFLSEMDGFDEHSPFVILSTNLPEALDPAVIREGRIDLKVEIKRPDKEDGEDIFRIHLNKVKNAEPIEHLAKIGTEALYSSGAKVSGAMIATTVNGAAMEAMYRYLDDKSSVNGVTTRDLNLSINKIINNQIHQS